MSDIHIYINDPGVGGSPTVGGVDGLQVSEAGAGTRYLTATLVVPDTSSAVKSAIRADAGKVTSGNVTIVPTGTNAAKWELSWDNTTWTASLTTAVAIGATNKIFYARRNSTAGDPVETDLTVTFRCQGQLDPV